MTHLPSPEPVSAWEDHVAELQEALVMSPLALFMACWMHHFQQRIVAAKHLVLPAPVGPPSSYEMKTW